MIRNTIDTCNKQFYILSY